MSEMEALIKDAQEQVALANQRADEADRRAAVLLMENQRLRERLAEYDGHARGTYVPAPEYGPGKPA